MSEIAAALDVGKGAIAGLSFRHRDQFPAREQGKTLGNEKRRKPMELLEPAEYDAKRIKRGKTLLDLGACDCRWMVSDTLFCAAEQKPGKSYCEHHYKRSRGQGTISERQAALDALNASRNSTSSGVDCLDFSEKVACLLNPHKKK